MTLLCATQKELSRMIGQAAVVACLSALCLSVGGCSDEGKSVSVSAADLAATNEILAKEPQVRLDREDFGGSHQAATLLHVLVSSQYRGPYVVGSSDSLGGIMGDLSRWLRGREKSEAVLRQLCQDPQFRFEGNRWTVVFHVLRSDGGVDEWTAVGEYDPQSKVNKVEKMENRPVRTKGTFFYPLAG